MGHFLAGRLKLALLLPLALALLVLVGIFSWMFYLQEEADAQQHSEQTFAAVERAYHAAIRADTEKLSSVLELVLRNQELQQALQQQNRDALLQISQPLFDQLKQQYGITHFYFTDPQQKVLLRVHNPQLAGDVIQRRSMQLAVSTQKSASGLELGVSGTFTLRVVFPWYYKQQLIGYVELGEEIEHILQNIKHIHHTELYVAINKEQLQRDKWQAGMLALQRQANWDLLSNRALTFHSTSTVNPAVLDILNRIAEKQLITFNQDIFFFQAGAIPLQDISQQKLGILLATQDVTSSIQNIQKHTWMIVGFGLLIVTVIFSFFTLIVSWVNRRINKAADALGESNQKLSAIYDGANDAIMLLNQQGFFDCNRQTLILFGFDDKADFLRHHPAQLSPVQQADGVDSEIAAREKIQQAYTQGKILFEWRHCKKNGEIFPAEVLLSSFEFAGQQVLQASVRDISSRKQIEHDLQQSEKLWSFALEGAGDSVWDWNLITGAVTLSKAGAQMFGYDNNDHINHIQHWFQRLNPLDQQRWQQLLQQFFQQKSEKFSVEYRVRCKDESYKWILTRGMVAERTADGKVTRMVGVHTDIHQRKLAEERLALFGSIFNAADRAIGVADANCVMHYVNPAFSRLLGYSSAEMVGQHMDTIRTVDSNAKLPEILQITQQGQSWNGLLTMRRKDGSEFLSASSVGAILDEQGKHLYLFNIFYDYTPEVERQQQLQHALEQADTANRTKSEFLACMSHELRTPLTSLIGSLGLIQGGVAGAIPDKAKALLEIGYNNAQRLLLLINDILDISKIEAGKLDYHMEVLDLNQLIPQSLKNIEHYGSKLQVRFSYIPVAEPAWCLGDSNRLNQVLNNLLSNAAKFSPAGSQVDVALHTQQQLHTISVIDHGSGIPAEFHDKIFEKFTQADSSSTRKTGGTGLGLHISRAIVEAHHGSIRFSSVAGQGTTFIVTLPCHTA